MSGALQDLVADAQRVKAAEAAHSIGQAMIPTCVTVVISAADYLAAVEQAVSSDPTVAIADRALLDARKAEAIADMRRRIADSSKPLSAEVKTFIANTIAEILA